MKYNIIWKENKNGITIVRMYGESQVIEIPEFINSIPVTEIGEYCFSKNSRIDIDGLNKLWNYDDLTLLCGDNIESVIIPDCVSKIGNYSFFGCNKLKSIEIGRYTEDFGSDAFMNCNDLGKIKIRCSHDESSGVRELLNHISNELEVQFLDTMDSVLFPEYYETYEEIAPAHIFGLSVTGEGFRARQCFKNKIMDFAQYDLIFEKACLSEREDTLTKIALCRLSSSFNLDSDSKIKYEGYLKKHIEMASQPLIKNNNVQMLKFICKSNLVDREAFDVLIKLAAKEDKPKCVAALIEFKNELFPTGNHSSRYSFDM